MGYIKGHFCSLRGLRQQIDDSVNHEQALAWVKACIVIHTLILLIEKGGEDPQFVDELVEEGHDHTVPSEWVEIDQEVQRETRGQRRCIVLKEQLFNFLE